MTHFLRVANAIEDRDPKIKVWVKQVREAAYDTTDALDMYMLRLRSRHHQSTRFPRHQIASEVKGIKSRIINTSERHQRYSDMHSKKEQGSSSTHSNIAWYHCRGDALLLEEADLVGIDKPKSHLIHLLVDEDPRLKVEELLKDMIRVLFEEVKQPLPRGVDSTDANNLKGIINAFLQQKSRVILTTRNVDLASFASEEYHGMIFLKIYGKCEGLPLAIVAISGLLSTKEKSADEWEMIYRSLGAELEGNDKLKSMKKILSLSYFDLPYYLKLCFLYLSIFPEDCLIDHWRLIRLWVAEGFVEVKEGMTKEEVAEGYLNELMNRSLVQVTRVRRDGRFKAYRIHDLWCEMIIVKSREQNIVTIASERGRAWLEKLRRLSIHHNFEDIQESICFTRLRSLLVFSAIDSVSILSKVASLGKGVSLLMVLDLRGAQLETFPHEIVELLNLTYLSLRATNVKMIPKAIGKLKKLETLDLKHTNVTELPDEILKLQHLRHLLLCRYNVNNQIYFPFHSTIGFKAPAGIGSLLYLQKLCAIEANRGSNSGIVVREVGKLAQLRRLAITMLQKEDGTMLCSSLEKLKNLRSLYVAATKEDEIIDLDSLSSPPQLLQRLYLKGCLEKIPHWIPSLHNLKRVTLRWSKLKDVDPLHSLQDLPNLLFLELHTVYEGDGLFFKAGGFQKLKELWLIRLVGLKWVRVGSSSMPLLERFILHDCKLMMELPFGVEHLTNLKELELCDMSGILIWRLKKDLQGGDY
ncbi:disease resistance protein RPM1-like [Rhododendron vialii]|uniref:disease resistance protein RPM1-like n=1 Tax=Rhododendron vialii TaxID=182163 RepID=UPI00265F8F5E|nr:disease resistance protein RPM1-like [Rhododendron vialii]